MVTRTEDRSGRFADGSMDGKRFAEHIDVAHGTVKRWLLEGLPCRRVGHRVYIHPETALPWVRDHYGDSIAFSRASVVYFVRRDSDRAIKIGWASDLVRRVHEIRRDERCICQIVACFEGTKPDELALHSRFESDRIEGEWYRASEALVAFIASIGRTAAA